MTRVSHGTLVMGLYHQDRDLDDEHAQLLALVIVHGEHTCHNDGVKISSLERGPARGLIRDMG
jgi:hypothetical protein